MDVIFDTLVQLLQQIPFEFRLATVFALIFIDAAMGAFLAYQNGEFDWDKLPQFLWTNVTRFGGGYAFAHSVLVGSRLFTNLVDFGVTVDESAVFAAWAAVTVKFAKDLVEKGAAIIRNFGWIK